MEELDEFEDEKIMLGSNKPFHKNKPEIKETAYCQKCKKEMKVISRQEESGYGYLIKSFCEKCGEQISNVQEKVKLKRFHWR